MKRLPMTFLLIVLIGILLQCAKKETEEVIIRPENMDVEVTVPEFEKGKSVFIKVTGEGLQNERDVMAESIRNGLSRDAGLYGVSSPEASESSTDYVLEGQIEKQNGQLEIITVLRDQDNTVFSDQHYLNDEVGLIQVSEEIATRAIAALNPESAMAPIVRDQKSDADVVPLYLQSKELLSMQTHAGTDQAISGLKQVVRIDPNFIPAWLSLADAYLQIHERGWSRNLIWLQLAQQSAITVIQLDSLQVDAYQVMGRVYQLRGDDLHAEFYYRKALAIHPRLPLCWAGLGQIFSRYGLYDAALEAYEHAFAIQNNSTEFSINYAMLLIGLKRYIESQSVLERAIQQDVNAQYLQTFLALTHYYSGDFQKASSSLQIGLQDMNYQPLSHAVQAMVFTKTGRMDDALGEVELEVKPAVGSNASMMTAVAAIYTLLGRNGEAITWLEKAVDAGYREYPWIANDPNFSGLKGDERFDALMLRLKGLWEAQVRDYFQMQG
ncbi:hypothetical protein HQ585_17665 [candidate division KSB1 bacterium]|nr:hypothetical protein [candidate division KSB1 bacterium]